MVSDLVFCRSIEEIKALLGKKSTTSPTSPTAVPTATKEDLILQYPDSTSDISLPASGTYTRSVSLNRKLRSITVSCPDGVLIDIKSDGVTMMWFYGEAGHEEFPNGKTIGTLTVSVTNGTASAARFSVRLVFE